MKGSCDTTNNNKVNVAIVKLVQDVEKVACHEIAAAKKHFARSSDRWLDR
jgi:hypothetical protein